jgi:hypothetical protein
MHDPNQRQRFEIGASVVLFVLDDGEVRFHRARVREGGREPSTKLTQLGESDRTVRLF